MIQGETPGWAPPTSYIERQSWEFQRGQEGESFQDRWAESTIDNTPTTFIEPPLNIQQSANHHMCVRKALKVKQKSSWKITGMNI